MVVRLLKLNSGRRLVDDDVGLGVEFWPRLKSGRRRVVVVVVGRRVVGRRVEEATKTPAGPAARANEASPVAELLDALEMAATECEPPTPGDATDAKLAACCALALANNPAIKESISAFCGRPCVDITATANTINSVAFIFFLRRRRRIGCEMRVRATRTDGGSSTEPNPSRPTAGRRLEIAGRRPAILLVFFVSFVM